MSRARVRARTRNKTAKSFADMSRDELEFAAIEAGFPAFACNWKTETLVEKLEAMKGENEHV